MNLSRLLLRLNSSQFTKEAEIFKNFYGTFLKKIDSLKGYELGSLFVHLYNSDFQFKEGFWIDNLQCIELFFEKFISFLPDNSEEIAKLLNLLDHEKIFITNLCCISTKICDLVSTKLNSIIDDAKIHSALEEKLFP